LRTANSYDGKGSHRIFIPYFQLLIQMIKLLTVVLVSTSTDYREQSKVL